MFGAGCAAAAWSWIDPIYIELGLPPTFGWILAFAGALLITTTRAGWLRPVVLACCLVVILGTTDLILQRVEARFQPVFAGFAWINGFVLGWLGEIAGAAQGGTHLHVNQGAFTVLPTMGLLALRPLVLSWVAVTVTVVSFRSGGRSQWLGRCLPWILVSTVAFAARFAWTSVKYAHTESAFSTDHHLALITFWDPWTVLATLAVCALLLGARSKGLSAGRWSLPTRGTLVRALVVGLSSGAALSWVDPGKVDLGRVLIDDAKSGIWEPSGRLLTTDRYGDFSAYSMAAMTEHLSRRYAVEVNAHRSYTLDYLSGFDVLILKTPYDAFSAEECQAVAMWVEQGGGLFVIGDHTDLAGMSTHLNAVVDPFGIRFRFDQTGPSEGGTYDLWTDPVLSDHPVTHEMDSFSFMTGCSLALSGRARPVMTLQRSASRTGDYSRSSHFTELAPRAEEVHGALVVAAATQFGRGRVIAFADSTVLSSFSYFVESRADFVQRSVSWLNRSPSWTCILPWIWALMALVAWIGLWRQPLGLEGWAALGLGCLLGSAGSIALAAQAMQTPDSPHPAPRIGFVAEGGHAWLPPALGSVPDVPEHGNLTTFIQIPQRLGYETAVVGRKPSVLASLDVLVVLNPDVESGQAEPAAAWVRSVNEWVNNGGQLLVLQRRAHLDHDHVRAHLYLPDHLTPQACVSPDLEVSAAAVGQGQVIRLLGSEVLDAEGLGHCMELPAAVQRQRYEACYDVFRSLGGLDDSQRQTYRFASALEKS